MVFLVNFNFFALIKISESKVKRARARQVRFTLLTNRNQRRVLLVRLQMTTIIKLVSDNFFFQTS